MKKSVKKSLLPGRKKAQAPFSKLFIILTGILFLYGCKTSETNSPYIPVNYLGHSLPMESILSGESASAALNPHSGLSVPTYITKINEEYFIVDCYNNQVIYNSNLTDPLYTWKVMTSDLEKGHTIASDGSIYLIDDTENHRILIMEKTYNREGEIVFVPTQEYTGIGSRPHYIIYDEKTDTFYAWSSMTGEMYLFRHPEEDNTVYLTEIRSIESLAGTYVRSFTILNQDIYFVSGNSSIIRADLNTFKIKEEYPVPPELDGMIQITKIQDYFYITISTDQTGNQDYATIIRTKNLKDLIKGEYEDIYHYFIGGGTPYYLSGFENKWFLTEHRLPGHSIWSFSVENNEIQNVTALY